MAFNPGQQNWDYIAKWENVEDRLAPVRSRITILDDQGGIYGQKNSAWPTLHLFQLDIDGDSTNELLISFADDSITGLQILKWPSLDVFSEFRLFRKDFEWVTRNRDVWDVRFDNVALVDGVLPGRSALLITVEEGFTLIPAGLWLIDPLNGEEKWRTYLCGGVNIPIVVDGNGDGREEILVGTSASLNGAVWDTLDDARQYIFCLDNMGKINWGQEFFQGFGKASIYLLPTRPQQTQREIIALCAPGSNTDGIRSQFLRIEVTSGKIVSSAQAPRVIKGGHLYPWKQQNERPSEFVVASRTRFDSLYVIDENLHEVVSCKYKAMWRWSGDLDGDGEFEHLIQRADNQTLLVDDKFRCLASSQIVGEFITAQRKRDETCPSIYLSWENVRYELQPRRNDLYPWQITARVSILLAVIGVSIFGGRSVLRLRRQLVQERRERHLRENFALAAGMLERHEITSPITTALREAMNIRQELATINVQDNRVEMHESANQIIRELSRARDSLNPLIEILKGVSPALRPASLDDALLRIVDNTLLPANVRISFESPEQSLFTRFDERWITIAIRNLLENSIKAMPDGGIIQIKLSEEQSLHEQHVKGDRIQLDVSDSGTGILAEHLPHIFELGFTQAKGGKGIGLWLVKYILDAHHAEIRCASTLGTGTTFTISFPHEG